jgi:hypothetical protein
MCGEVTRAITTSGRSGRCGIVRPAEAVATALIERLGGYGRAYIAFVAFGRGIEVSHLGGGVGRIPGPIGVTPIAAWTETDGRLANEYADRMRRELLRACGLPVWEPPS